MSYTFSGIGRVEVTVGPKMALKAHGNCFYLINYS